MRSITQIQQGQEVIVAKIVELTGLPSRWNGNIIIRTDSNFRGEPLFAGAKDWTCDIWLHASILHIAQCYSTGIHEGFHSVSVGLEPDAYDRWKGYEEGVVEQCTRLFREKILEDFRLARPFDRRVSYDFYIEPLERLRAWTRIQNVFFYQRLLSIPVAEREKSVVEWIIQTNPHLSLSSLPKEIEETLRTLKEPIP